ncbi:MAG: 30S ribosomal protein S17 [Candidatus Omnitrophica bacterium]|nr:30S ribosomal protein S17 [Candidatus Omnitrophota bacterium]
MSTTTAPPTARNQRKVRIGVVTSNAMQKTIVVRIVRLVRHPKYNRTIKQVTSFKAHDEANQASVGDWVKIMETRPLSKDKRWRLVEILRRASSAPPVPGNEEPARAQRTVAEPMPAPQQPCA